VSPPVGPPGEPPDPWLIEEARRLVHASNTIVALTGAGISTEAGIPDFRGPQGVWTRNPGAERLSTLDNYLSDPEVRRASWQARLGAPIWSAAPTAGHLALVELERSGRLHMIVTQNVDGLHLAAGNDPGKVVEIHGSSHTTIC
jgi:NAD-dependent deacetylase